VDYLNLSDSQRQKYLTTLDQKAVSLEDIHGKPVNPSLLASNFGVYLAEGMGVQYTLGDFSIREKQKFQKYGSFVL
jgi:hypothetical protein